MTRTEDRGLTKEKMRNHKKSEDRGYAAEEIHDRQLRM